MFYHILGDGFPVFGDFKAVFAGYLGVLTGFFGSNSVFHTKQVIKNAPDAMEGIFSCLFIFYSYLTFSWIQP